MPVSRKTSKKKKEASPPKRKKYYIVVNYDSGSSFGIDPDHSCVLIEEWDNLDIAKENLKRIEAHYKAQKGINGWKKFDQWENYKTEPWFSKRNPEYEVQVLKDDGSSCEEYCQWIGYFERMNYAEIKVREDNGMKIYG